MQSARKAVESLRGFRKDLASARIVIQGASVVLAENDAQVMDLLAELHRDGQTVLLVTHDARLAARHGERVISLVDGRVVDDARMEASSATPRDVVRITSREVVT